MDHPTRTSPIAGPRTGALLTGCLLFFGHSQAHAALATRHIRLHHGLLAELDPPPVQRPSNDPPAPTPEPSEAPPAPSPAPTPAPAPPDEGSLPRYDSLQPRGVDFDEAQDHSPALREVPSDARGMLAAGGIVTGIGSASFITSLVFATDGNTEPFVWIPMLVLGSVGTGVGGALLGIGRRRHREYRAWAAQQSESIPPQGNGLIGSAGTLLVAGTLSVVIGGFAWEQSTFGFIATEPATAAPVLIAVGGTSVGVGATLMIIGARRHKRFSAWRQATSEHARLRLAPIIAPARGGLQLGLSGSF